MDHLSKAELLEILGVAYHSSRRDWLMMLVAFHHGLRASEVTGLKRANFAGGFLTVQRLKGSLKTTQELVEHQNPLLNERQALIDYMARMQGNQRLFPISRVQFYRRVRKHAAQTSIPRHRQNVKIFKHSIAMQTIQQAGIENVRQHLGHKSISSTGEYLKVSDADAGAAVRRALKAL